MNTIFPPLPLALISFAAACAQRNEPVVLMSRVRRHSSGLMSIACVQPTTPAKQQRMSRPCNSWAAEVMAALTLGASVTLTCLQMIFALGKSLRKLSMAVDALDGLRSKRPRPVTPCSSRARAASRASVPAPPVTVEVHLLVSYVWNAKATPMKYPGTLYLCSLKLFTH